MPEYCVKWGFGTEAWFKKKVDYMLEAVAVSKRQGLSGKRFIYTFMQRWIQPLKACRNPMWQYADESDHDCHSIEVLSKGEVEAHINIVTLGVTLDFMDEGGSCRGVDEGVT